MSTPDDPSSPATHRRALMADIQSGYDRLTAYLDTLDEAALTVPTDAAGWTANDHVMHLAAWAGSMIAVIDGQPRWEAIGVSRDVWTTIADGYDVINAAIQRRHAGRPSAEVRRAFDDTHRALVARVEALSIDDLTRPYSHYQPWAVGRDEPLYGYIRGNTVEHYDEHRGYIEVLVGGR